MPRCSKPHGRERRLRAVNDCQITHKYGGCCDATYDGFEPIVLIKSFLLGVKNSGLMSNRFRKLAGGTVIGAEFFCMTVSITPVVSSNSRSEIVRFFRKISSQEFRHYQHNRSRAAFVGLIWMTGLSALLAIGHDLIEWPVRAPRIASRGNARRWSSVPFTTDTLLCRIPG